ncbi:hypothetical protein [Actinoplanes sp. N902-109]|uniref:hypothetical protein n=1 Tax=Actinoplanes sp. (strain N902-109) TaxID=649831 RepID=UPI0003295A5E|nr:hypothetical protein [Actinoplanes sp. N902-109]AGL16924.1 hypothetical protein L083_3414 [Actinoplanes sp. N902-109]
MSSLAMRHRPAPAARRTGYVIAAAVNVVLLYLINGHPGWAAVPFLTGDFGTVVGLMNVSLIVAVVVNGLQVLHDPPRVVAFGSLVTTGIGLAVLIRLWQVFPFYFGDGEFLGTLLARILLIVLTVGSGIGVLVQFRDLVRGTGPDRKPR